MFNKLEHKIKTILILTIFSGIVLSLIIAYSTSKKILMDDFIEQSMQSTKQLSKNIQLHGKLIEETSDLLLHNPRIINALKNSNYDITLLPIIDGIISSNLSVIGVTLYGNNGIVYASSSISNPPSLGILLQGTIPVTFSESQQLSLWQVRYNNMQEFYTTNQYYSEKKNGLLTYVAKVFDTDGTIIGYLLVDTSMSPIYNFFRNESNMFLKDANTYIIDGNASIISSPYNMLTNQNIARILYENRYKDSSYIFTHNKGAIVIFNRIINSNATIVLYIPFARLYTHLAWLMAALLVFCISFCILSVTVIGIVVKSISTPMNHLYSEMNEIIETFH